MRKLSASLLGFLTAVSCSTQAPAPQPDAQRDSPTANVAVDVRQGWAMLYDD